MSAATVANRSGRKEGHDRRSDDKTEAPLQVITVVLVLMKNRVRCGRVECDIVDAFDSEDCGTSNA